MVIAHSRRFRACTVLLAVTVSACATGMNDPALTPAQQEMIQSNNRFNQTVGEGAAAGAALGMLAGLAFGGVRGMAIGAVAGGLTGAAVGYGVARNNYLQSQNEGNLQAAIKEAQDEVAASEREAAIARRIGNDAQAQAAALDAQFQARKISAQQYQQNLASFARSADQIQKSLEASRQAAAGFRQSAAVAGPDQATTFAQAAERIEASNGAKEQEMNRIRALLSATPRGA